MKIGIIVAMGKEFALLKPLLGKSQQCEIDGYEFSEGIVGNNDVIIMKCGIGKVNAAIGAMALINNFKPELIINSGVAGGADKTVNVMDIVLGQTVAYHDVWCGPECELGAVQGLPLYYNGDKTALNLVTKGPNIKYGLIVSGDQFIDTKEKLETIKTNFPDALAVDMESGAIAQVCELKKTPFLSMRVISDSPGASHNNTQQYNDFWTDAPTHTFSIVSELLNKL